MITKQEYYNILSNRIIRASSRIFLNAGEKSHEQKFIVILNSILEKYIHCELTHEMLTYDGKIAEVQLYDANELRLKYKDIEEALIAIECDSQH